MTMGYDHNTVRFSNDSQIPPRSLLDSYSIISASYCVHEGLQTNAMNVVLELKHKCSLAYFI